MHTNGLKALLYPNFQKVLLLLHKQNINKPEIKYVDISTIK
jgi:hypothetical protein